MKKLKPYSGAQQLILDLLWDGESRTVSELIPTVYPDGRVANKRQSLTNALVKLQKRVSYNKETFVIRNAPRQGPREVQWRLEKRL